MDNLKATTDAEYFEGVKNRFRYAGMSDKQAENETAFFAIDILTLKRRGKNIQEIFNIISN